MENEEALRSRKYDECNRYAFSLVQSLAARFPAVPGFRPLPDLMGKLTQIDNMTAKLREGFGAGTPREPHG